MATRTRRGPADPLRVRPSGPGDLALLVRHRQGMWEDIGVFTVAEIRRANPTYRAWARREARAGRFFGFVAETRSGVPMGSGAVWLQPQQPRPGALSGAEAPYILSMYTERAYRGRGVASEIVRTMIDWARRRGFPRVTLHASAQGRPVYERLGFENANEMRVNLRRIGKGRPASRIPRRAPRGERPRRAPRPGRRARAR
jgi:GNAT superfamily N-acetyltransferase